MLLAGAWLQLGSRIGALEVEIGKVKQAIADGGTHEIVSQLGNAKTPDQVAANMTVIRGQVQLALANGNAPNQEKINTLAPAVVKIAKEYPSVTESWQAVAALATFKTASLLRSESVSGGLPDCDAREQKAQFLEPPDVPGFGLRSGETAYLFKNCVLHLDQLPGHAERSAIIPPGGGQPRPITFGVFAYAINVVIVADDHGISDTDILGISTRNCRFEFRIDALPLPREQRVLLAGLQQSLPGVAQLPLGGV